MAGFEQNASSAATAADENPVLSPGRGEFIGIGQGGGLSWLLSCFKAHKSQ
jgi:hypothetical protein